MDKYEKSGAYTRRIVPSGVCFRCSCSLRYMVKEKGYYAAVIRINGNDIYMHQHCVMEELEEQRCQLMTAL